MTPAKAHPYLVSFGKLGLITQDAGSGRYGLGPLAMQLGLISLQQFDPVRLATARLAELAQQLGQTVAIAVWGNHGPTIVRTDEAPLPVHVSMRHGTVMSLRGTASGRLFAAYLPRAVVRAAAEARSFDKAFEAELAAVRTAGLSHVVDAAVPASAAWPPRSSTARRPGAEPDGHRRVVQRLVEPGSTVVPGTPLLKLVDPATLWVAMRVDEVGGRPRAARASRRRSACAPARHAGRWRASRASRTLATRELEVHVAFDTVPGRFAIDQEAEVAIDGGRGPRLRVPVTALRATATAGPACSWWRRAAPGSPVTPGASDGESRLIVRRAGGRRAGGRTAGRRASRHARACGRRTAPLSPARHGPRRQGHPPPPRQVRRHHRRRVDAAGHRAGDERHLPRQHRRRRLADREHRPPTSGWSSAGAAGRSTSRRACRWTATERRRDARRGAGQPAGALHRAARARPGAEPAVHRSSATTSSAASAGPGGSSQGRTIEAPHYEMVADRKLGLSLGRAGSCCPPTTYTVVGVTRRRRRLAATRSWTCRCPTPRRCSSSRTIARRRAGARRHPEAPGGAGYAGAQAERLLPLVGAARHADQRGARAPGAGRRRQRRRAAHPRLALLQRLHHGRGAHADAGRPPETHVGGAGAVPRPCWCSCRSSSSRSSSTC
jgi:hypothetical protein